MGSCVVYHSVHVVVLPTCIYCTWARKDYMYQRLPYRDKDQCTTGCVRGIGPLIGEISSCWACLTKLTNITFNSGRSGYCLMAVLK